MSTKIRRKLELFFERLLDPARTISDRPIERPAMARRSGPPEAEDAPRPPTSARAGLERRRIGGRRLGPADLRFSRQFGPVSPVILRTIESFVGEPKQCL